MFTPLQTVVSLAMVDHDRLMGFHRDGYLGPLPLATSFLTPAARNRLAETVGRQGTHSRHLDSRLVFDLCTDPAVLEAVNAILGADLLLWDSAVLIRGGGPLPTAWHQDLHRWPTALTVTAWLALTDAHDGSGCLEVLPGSHRALLPLAPPRSGSWSEFEADPAAIPNAPAHPIPMPAGHFVVLSDRVLHRSKPAAALAKRWALAARFTAPSVHVPYRHCILVSGEDHF
ncbi:MAG TPA: phytanoyl-CoA dioxygenase family protein, partial [Gemmatimonadales bacterium]|nr:phytanoyl-CoA dioxygenase family protein [Gemmatimonadales bacterium]